MQEKHVELKNPENGYEEEIKVGFSWTTFFFGAFVPLFRADWKWFSIMLAVAILISLPVEKKYETAWDIFGFFISLSFAFSYNRLYINDKLKKGWKPNNLESEKRLKEANYTF